MKRCPHCMQNSLGVICSHCGKSMTAEAHLSHLPVGTILNNRYEVGVVLGQGGFGITYVAWDQKKQQKVAIKEYFPNRCTSKTRQNRTIVCAQNGYEQIYNKGMQNFVHEGQTLLTIAHIPEVVHVLDGFNANNTAYIVMEFIEGSSLEKVVTQKGRMSVEETAELFHPLIKVLEQLHQMNVTHRDISPDNIICMSDGRLKLIDFGSARQIENGKSVSITLKPGFSPPEQYTTRGQGPWTDVYALTATMYYCLCGKRPLSAPERMEGQDSLELPSDLGVSITKEQEKVLLWGLTIQPKERAANMTVFARQFYEVFPAEQDTKPVEETGGQTIEPNENDGIKADQTNLSMEEVDVEEQKIINSDDQPKLYNKKDQDTGKKKQKKTFILIFAAVMLILLGILLYCLPTILQNMNPVFRTQTENGMTVEIDREKGTVTLLDVGSAADELIVSLDETVTAERYGRMDGTYDLTKIAAGAFRDRSTMYRLILPSTVTVIEDGAFNHCDHLRFMTISSSVSMDSGAFVDMEKPLIWRKDSSLSVPQGFESYTYGEETRYGKLIDLSYDEQGILYGRTDQNSAVVLDIPGELNEFVLDDLSTECLLKGMTDNAMDTLDMPRVYVNCESFLYPKELNGKAEWIFDDSENKGYNLAGSWYLSLEVTEMLSEDYGEISCSEELICAADDILNHCMNSNSEKPLEESDWGTILDEYGVDWNNAQALYEASRSADELEILYNAIETAYDAKNEGNAYNRMALIILDDGEWCESICILHN